MAQMARGFVQRVFMDSNGRPAPYTLFVPEGYDGDRDWPAILFLHGAGETGSDGGRPAKVGLGPAVARSQDSFPFFAIFPQSQRGTWQAGTADAQRALAILDQVQLEFRIDPARVHLTGISMGGYGAWSLASAVPTRWASIVPVCGGGDPGDAGLISLIPCWAFHGTDDDIIPVQRTREMIDSIEAEGGNPKYTEFPGVGHNSWDPAYATPGLFDWMLAQSRPETSPR